MKNNDKLYYRVSGNGYPVVFLHGFLESLNIWEVITPSLNCMSVCIDLPGHGKSAAHSFETIEDMAELVMDTLASIGIDEFHVIGHSMGGYVALELKRRVPGCGKVVLLNSNFWEDNENKKTDRVRVASIVLKNKARFVNEVIPNLFSDPSHNIEIIDQLISEAANMNAVDIAGSSLAMRNRFDMTALLQQHASDFVIIQGNADRIMPESVMLEKIAGLKVKYYTVRSGHMAWFESPEEVIKILDENLQC